MKVLLRVSISGTRDGVEWPPKGAIIDLPDAEAVDMLNGGLAIAAPVPEPERAVVAPVVEKAIRTRRAR